MNKTLLMISYGFPPKGGSGVQRNIKFLKYLNELNWKTHVLTVKDTLFPTYDYCLLNEINNTEIHRTNSLDPFRVYKLFYKKSINNTNNIKIGTKTFLRKIRDFIFVPDAYIGWVPFAIISGLKILRKNNIHVLFCSFPSPSNALITYILSKLSGKNYFIDFRDPWLEAPFINFPTILHKLIHINLEKLFITNSKFLIVYGEQLKLHFANKYPSIKENIYVIPNGFDPSDFNHFTYNASDRLRLVHFGGLYDNRRITFTNFIIAISKLPISYKNRLKISFVGLSEKWAVELCNNYQLSDIISFINYTPHELAIEYLINSEGSLLFLSPGDEHALSGKLFEYIGIGNPIVACIDVNGACATFLNNINMNEGICSLYEVEEIRSKILDFIDGKLPKIDESVKSIYSRKIQSLYLNNIIIKYFYSNLK